MSGVTDEWPTAAVNRDKPQVRVSGAWLHSVILKASVIPNKVDVLLPSVLLASDKCATPIPSFITAAPSDEGGQCFSGVLTVPDCFLLKQAAAVSLSASL